MYVNSCMVHTSNMYLIPNYIHLNFCFLSSLPLTLLHTDHFHA